MCGSAGITHTDSIRNGSRMIPIVSPQRINEFFPASGWRSSGNRLGFCMRNSTVLTEAACCVTHGPGKS